MDIISYALSKKGMQQSVSDYLDEHLTNPTNPPLDTSLEIAGAAADSKATGDKLSALKEDLTQILPGWHYGYKTTTGATGGTSGTDRQYSDFILCPEGATVKYVAETNHSTIAGISFYGKNGDFISGIANSGEMGTEQTATAPTDSMYCVISTKTTILAQSYAHVQNSVVDTVQTLVNADKANKKNIKYISPSGSDSAKGTSNDPYKTLNKAITEGASVVYAIAGKYAQPPVTVLSGVNGFEFYVINSSPAQSSDHKPKAVFENACDLSVSENSGTGLLVGTHTFGTNSNWYKVFVSQALPISPTGMQSTTYNAILWECDPDDETQDIKLQPVLALNTCQSTAGSFYYDHNSGKIYINPSGNIDSAEYKYLQFESGTMVYINGCSNVHIEDLEVKHSPDYGVRVVNSENIQFVECKSTHVAYRNCFECSGSNCTFVNCEALKATADGFGVSSRGMSNFIGCSGHHNYDDGVSHHDGTTGSVRGGHWHHNSKAGVASPYSGARVDIYDALLDNNAYGLYASTGTDECIVSGCAFIDNNTAALLNSGYTLHLYNNVMSGNAADVTGAGNTIIHS